MNMWIRTIYAYYKYCTYTLHAQHTVHDTWTHTALYCMQLYSVCEYVHDTMHCVNTQYSALCEYIGTVAWLYDCTCETISTTYTNASQNCTLTNITPICNITQYMYNVHSMYCTLPSQFHNYIHVHVYTCTHACFLTFFAAESSSIV